MLYINENKKAKCMTFLCVLVNLKMDDKVESFLASKITSPAGEKFSISSTTQIPKSLFDNAPASFNPSPTIATNSFSDCIDSMYANLSCGNCSKCISTSE